MIIKKRKISFLRRSFFKSLFTKGIAFESRIPEVRFRYLLVEINK